MRSVQIQRFALHVSDDPGHVIGELLEVASSPSVVAHWESWFSPQGPGLAARDTVGAHRASDLSEASGLREPWRVWKDIRGAPSLEVMLEGDELRALLREAVRLRGVLGYYPPS